MRYSVDSIKEGKAVLLLPGNEQFVAELSELPEGIKEGDLLEGDPQRGYRILPEETASKRKKLVRQISLLAEK